MMIFHSDISQRLVLNVCAVLQVVVVVVKPSSADQGESAGCYYWLMSKLEEVSPETPLTRYHMWIVSPQYASPTESLRDAVSPSKFSEVLSDQFYYLGQDPIVQLAGGSTSETADQLKAEVIYSMNLSIWNVTFDTLELLRYMGQNLLISGRAICLYECAVGNTMEMIKINPTVRYDLGTAQAQNGMQSVGVIMEPCDKKTMLLLTSTGVFVSQNSLLSSQKLALPEFGNKPVSVTGAVIFLMKFMSSISQHLIIVTNDGIFNIVSDKFGTQELVTKRLAILELSKATGVAASRWMCDLHSDERQQMPIAFWDASGLVVTDSNFTKVTYPPNPPEGIIKDVQFTGHRTTISILTYDPATRQLAVWQLDKIMSSVPTKLCFWNEVTGSQKFTMTIAPVGITAFYVWNDLGVYYYFGPDSIGKLAVFGLPNADIGSSSDAIKQLVITLKTEVVIALTSGVLYYSKLMFKEAWKVSTTINATAILGSDEIGNMFTVLLDDSLNSKKVPLDLSYRTVAKDNTTLKCPFKDFQISGQDILNVYRVDLGEETLVWALLMLPEGVDDDVIKVGLQELDVMAVEISNEVHPEERGVSQYKEVKFSIIPEKVQRVSHGNTYLGHVGFQLVPVVEDPGSVVCPLPCMMFGYVYVGCNDFKYLRVRRSKGDDAECDMFRKKTPYRYTLNNYQIKYLNGTSGKADKTVEYDFAKLGCPITTRYTDVLFPGLEIVDDLKKTVMSVNGDFVIFERNSRIFGYNDTALGVRCTIPPQTWKDMVTSATETEIEYCWTPSNYKSCHSAWNGTDDEKEPVVPNDPYQILNGSNRVGLTFTHSASLGVYIFTAVVVDPNLSLCHLSTTFAVNVVGKLVRKDFLGLYISLCIFTVLLVVFVLTMYFYYRDHVYGR